MTIYIDADACPVKAEAERVATRHRVAMVLVSNGGIRPSANPLVQSVFVPDGPDEADKWIAGQCGPGDVVVTGDISHGGPLALSAHITWRFQQASPLVKSLDLHPIPLPFPGA